MTGHEQGRRLAHRNLHSHTWIFGVVGMAAGLFLMLFVPSWKGVSDTLLLFAGFHLVGGIVLLASLYVLAPRRWLRRGLGFRGRQTRHRGQAYRFGWGPEWMNGLAVIALAVAGLAVAIQAAAPAWWPLAFLALLLAAGFFAGNFILRSFRSGDHIVLPMVDLIRGDRDLVLDAGCGAGRTTLALSRVLRNGSVVAVDRFDAGYIEDGGRGLLVDNLRTAGLTGRVRVETGDLAALSFPAGTFDAAVSTHVFDHLGSAKAQALREVFRVLKPGGRFLMAVWVPGWAMFAVASVLSFFLTSKREWRALAGGAGFEVIDEGAINNAWFVLLQRPAAPDAPVHA
jgi:SAM-dependent methyltransferase